MLGQSLNRIRPTLNRLNVTAVIIMAAYVSLVSFEHLTGLNLYFIPGILLLFYLPGRLVLQICAPLQNIWGRVGQLALSVFISFSIMASVMILASRFGMTDKSAIYLMILINGLLFLANVLRQIYKGQSTVGLLRAKYTLSTSDIIVMIIPLIVVVATIALSPLASDADGFMTTLKKTIECSCVSSPFRPLFTTFFALIYHALGLSYLTLFRIVYPLLFVASTLFVFDYTKRRINSPMLHSVVYLAFLGAPVVISEINIIRPQVAMLVYTLPILMLLIESWRAKNILFTLVALWFGFVAIGFHELSIFLLVIAGLVCLWHIGRLVFVEKKISWQNIVLATIIIYPYLSILHVSTYLSRLMASINHAESLIPKLHWRWWFINNYISIDGINIGWPGVQAVYFYAYSGLLLLLMAILLGLWLLIKRNKIGWHFILPVLYALIFLAFAEILPRLGFFFLPNRAWVHLMLALSIILVLVAESLQKSSKNYGLALTMSAIIVVGISGTAYVAANNVSEVFSEEVKSIKYMQNTAPNSLFFSTQDNRTLVEFYGGRTLINLAIKSNIDRFGFYQMVTDTIGSMSIRKRVLVSPEIKEVTQRYVDGQFTSENVKLLAERQFAITEPQIKRGTPIYFIYSLRKSSGTNATRGYLANSLDITNRDVYQNTVFPIAYQDEGVIILKIR